MSSVNVEVLRVKNVSKHPNADRLDLAEVSGWLCVVQKGAFQPGDLCVYAPIDSVLPERVMGAVFGPDAKVKPSGGRIRTARIRGVISQGLALPLADIAPLVEGVKLREGVDLTEALGVTKYVAPVRGTQAIATKLKPRKSRKILHEKFARYTDMAHFQKHAWLLKLAHEESGIDIVGHCKIHGTSARYGWLKRTGWLDTLRAWLKLPPRYVFLMGSRNIDMQVGADTRTHSSLPNGVYSEICDAYELRERIPKGFSVYGEIIGSGVQPHYFYGHKEGQRSFYVYDVRAGDRWMSDWEIDAFCKNTGLKRVACVYRGPYDEEKMRAVALGPDPLYPMQKVREGVVFRLAQETEAHGTRVLFKLVSPDFLLSKGSEDEVPDVL